MAKSARNYSDKTLKLLFGASGNQCAEPNCTHAIIAPATPYSDAAILGQICHIYASSDDGPRGKPSLTAEERDAPDNLILLCGHHHPLVDKQWETYPAELLKEWKRAHEAKFQEGTVEAAKRQAAIHQLAFFQAYSDQQIIDEVERIRKGRLLDKFDTKGAAQQLATRIEAAEFAGGSTTVRAKALAWCARFLAIGDTADRARVLLTQSKALQTTEEATIAEAFLLPITDQAAALQLLAPLATAAARSAAFRIVTNNDQPQRALAWARRSGVSSEDLDSDGKFWWLNNELRVGAWDDAAATAATITEEDFNATPVLNHTVAMATLLPFVPLELRQVLQEQPPFEAHTFPLSSDLAALSARRRAIALFSRASKFAQGMGTTTAANPASNYALWLKLRDPRDKAEGIAELRASMEDPAQALRLMNLALQFGIQLDLAAIEHQIDQRIALSGKGSADDAFARFSLAFARGEPGNVADYLAQHRDLLFAHLQKNTVQTLEIELLARAGRIEAAKDTYKKAMADGLPLSAQQHLERIIAEAEGGDRASTRKQQYDKTHELRDLINLVSFLDDEKKWQELQPYAEELFARTGALEDAVRVAKVLNERQLFNELHNFLSSHQQLISQTTVLKSLWAWSLYREGRFEDALGVLNELTSTRDIENDRILRVNIAVASGRWDDLISFTNEEWARRDDRTPEQLLRAGQIAQEVGGPHAKDLIELAAQRAPDDPRILTAAYFHATSAGWEQNATTAQWLQKAAALSGSDGPLQRMSMQELLDRKPAWDKREADVWEKLNAGEMPIFGAAHLLHRSLTDFVLLQPIANLQDRDIRRHGTVYAYSGARPPATFPSVSTIGLDLAACLTLARMDLLERVVAYYNIIIPHSTLGWLMQERQRAAFHQPSRISDAHHLTMLLAATALRTLTTSLHDPVLEREVGRELADLITAAATNQNPEAKPRFVIRSSPVYRVGTLMEDEADLSKYSSYLCSCTAVVNKLRSKGLMTVAEFEDAVAYLKLHERPWPNEPQITDGAELLLDGLSITYLNTIGALHKLSRASLTAYIPESASRDANRLLELEQFTGRQIEILDRTRRTLADGLSSGKVRVVKSSEFDDDEPMQTHPTLSLLSITEPVDAFIVDDRSLNRHQTMKIGKATRPILTTLDLLDHMTSKGVMTFDEFYGFRTELRRAGFQLIPVTAEELDYHLDRAPLVNGTLTETAELRAIREALLLARMRKLLQIPLEIPWLQTTTNAIVKTIRSLWTKRPPADASAYSSWLITLLDVRGFAPSAVAGGERNFALYAYAAQILNLMTPPQGVGDDVREAYFEWIDERAIRDLKYAKPEAFAWIVERAKELIAQAAQVAAEYKS